MASYSVLWRNPVDYHVEELSAPSLSICGVRPPTFTPSSAYREKRARVAVPSGRARPKSSPPIAHSSTADKVTWGDYDMLTADIVDKLKQGSDDTEPKYGERIIIIGKDRRGECHMTISTERCRSPATAVTAQRSESSTSGVASLDSDDEEDTREEISEADDESSVEGELKSGGKKVMVEEEDKSDDERIPEPTTPPDKTKIRLPKVDWGLRQEKLDAYAIFEGKKDRSRYDFDASFIKAPRYEFANLFSPALMSLDLRALAERDAELQIKPTVSKSEAKILQRCLEFEKLQIATERVEDLRLSKSRQNIRQKSASQALSRSRAQSARSVKPSLRCSQDCTQIVCVGDCPGKPAPTLCSVCAKRNCNGACTPTPYDSHIRSEKNGNDTKKYRLPRPTSCKSCARDTNPSKKINLLQNQLGRPKSSHSTYSQAKKSVRQPFKLQTVTHELNIQDIPVIEDRVSVRPHTAPVRLRTPKPRRGRESVAPHKSYHSQRRISLTTSTVRPVFGVNMGSPKRRARSAKAGDRLVLS